MITFALTPLLISWFIIYFEPLKRFRFTPDELEENPKLYIYKMFCNKLVSCFKCNAFWLTLFITLNPLSSILNSIIAYVFDRLDNQLKYKT